MVESFLLIILITVNFFGVFDVCVGVFVLVVSLLGFDMIGGSGKEHLRLAFLHLEPHTVIPSHPFVTKHSALHCSTVVDWSVYTVYADCGQEAVYVAP